MQQEVGYQSFIPTGSISEQYHTFFYQIQFVYGLLYFFKLNAMAPQFDLIVDPPENLRELTMYYFVWVM